MTESIRIIKGAFLDAEWELLSIDEAAAELGIEPKRLRGYMFRNKIGDPRASRSATSGLEPTSWQANQALACGRRVGDRSARFTAGHGPRRPGPA